MFWNMDLWHEMDRLRRDMDRIFNEGKFTGRSATYPLVNIYDNNDDLIVTAELPGLTKDKVSITVTDDVLTIAGKLEPLSNVSKMIPVRQERASGEFEKAIRIPVKVQQNKINATFSDGVLTITLPKAEEAKPKTITIEAK